MSTIQERVAKGAALLDQKYPAWATSINLQILDQSTVTDCVLAQLHNRDYVVGRTALNLTVSEAHENGYSFSNNGDIPWNAAWAQLNGEWRKAILQRLDGDAPQTVVINKFHLAAAQATIADAVSKHATHIDGLSDAGVLLQILMDLGVQGLVEKGA